ncbi:hypothetical protein BGX20_006845 [Mortierella sp. AD010]|nr:hypothetical protein BGX20_006845 [Mortierella sp. AD010]
MAYSIMQQTKRVVDAFHNWLFGNSAYVFPDEPGPIACITAQVSTSDSCGAQGSQDNGRPGDYANAVHNKFASIASSATSAVSSTVANLFDSDDSSDKSDRKTFQGESSYHHILEKLQSVINPSYRQRIDPSAAWNDYIPNHVPNFHLLQSRLDRLSKSLGVETGIFVVMLLLLFALLLLIACAARRTGTKSCEEEFQYGIGVGREPDLLDTTGNQVRGSHTTEKAPADSTANRAHEHDVCRLPTSEFPKRTRRPSEGVMLGSLECASALQQEEDEIEFDNYENYEENVSENESVDSNSSTIQRGPSRSKSTESCKHHVTPVAKTDTSDMTKLASPDFAWAENTSMSESLTAAPTFSSKTDPNIEEAISTVISAIQDPSHQAEIPVDDTVQETSEEIRKAVEAALAFVAKTKVSTVKSVKKSVKSVSMDIKLEACPTGSSVAIRANKYYESSPFQGCSSSLTTSSIALTTRSMTPTKNTGKSKLILCNSQQYGTSPDSMR